MELDFNIQPLDEAAMAAARERQAQLAKPPGSLGRLEELSIQLAGITGKVHNKIEKKHLLVFAADNGVVEEGVSSAPQSVTLMQNVLFPPETGYEMDIQSAQRCTVDLLTFAERVRHSRVMRMRKYSLSFAASTFI